MGMDLTDILEYNYISITPFLLVKGDLQTLRVVVTSAIYSNKSLSFIATEDTSSHNCDRESAQNAIGIILVIQFLI